VAVTASFATIDAVTLDANGTLVRLRDPVPALRSALAAHGVERSGDEVRAAFRAEVAWYKPRSHEGSLEELRLGGAGVFLGALGADLAPAAFVEDFVGAIHFEPQPGALETVRRLRARGLALAVVANWDAALGGHLAETGFAPLVDAVVSSAGAGAAKPDPRIFHIALDRLGVEPGRALHVGDEPADEQGARAAGLLFAAAPLADAFAGWAA
jgi:HAD superfamily hydrolase (TIGR01509 family)